MENTSVSADIQGTGETVCLRLSENALADVSLMGGVALRYFIMQSGLSALPACQLHDFFKRQPCKHPKRREIQADDAVDV